jgi:cell division protein FtsQ
VPPLSPPPARLPPPSAPPPRPRRDPAPSRIRYRLARIWLRPSVRQAATLWLPLLCAAAAAWLVLTRPATYARIEATAHALREQVWSRPEFMLAGMTVEGGSADLQEQVREVVGVAFPVSSLALDLEAIRARVEALNAVESAQVSVAEGNRLALRIVERRPAAILRLGPSLALLDRTGAFVAEIDMRRSRPDLPLLVGQGADRAVPEALALVQVAAPLGGRLLALVRVGERRWDLLLDRDQRILLPESGAIQALERAMAMQRAEDLLGRDLSVFDLRDGSRPVLRLTQRALEAIGRTVRQPEGQDT